MATIEDTWKLDINTPLLKKVSKLDDRLSKLENKFSKVERSARGAEKELKDVGRAAAVASLGTERLSKGVEGAAQALGISAISGERLANGWLAAGAAAGGLAWAVGTVLTKAVKAYLASTEEGRDATERLTKSSQRFWEELGRVVMGANNAEQSVDNMAGAIDRATIAVMKHEDEIRQFVFYGVKALSGMAQVLSKTTASALTPVLGAIDLVKAGIGNLADNFLTLVEAAGIGANLVGAVTDEELVRIKTRSDALQQQLRDTTDLSNGLVVSLWDQVDAFEGYTDEMANAVLGIGDFSTDLGAADKALQKHSKALKDGTEAAKAFKAAKGMSAAEKKRTLEQGLAASLGDPDLGFLDKFSADMAGMPGDSTFTYAASFKAEQNLANLGIDDSLMNQFESITALDEAFEDFAKGGVMMAVDSMGMLIEQFASGETSGKAFLGATLASIGGALKELGKAAVAAGLIGDWFKKGGLIQNPSLGIALGIAAFALGSALSGFGSAISSERGGGGGGGRGASSRAARAFNRERREDNEDRREQETFLVMDNRIVGQVEHSRQERRDRRGDIVPASMRVRG